MRISVSIIELGQLPKSKINRICIAFFFKLDIYCHYILINVIKTMLIMCYISILSKLRCIKDKIYKVKK